MSSLSLNKKRSKTRSSLPPSSSKRSRSRSKSKTRSSLRSRLPSCRPVVYCGKNSKTLPSGESTKYDKVGKRDECFKKGIGVGMMLEMEKTKKKLLSKGIVLVLPKKKSEMCMDKNGNIKEQYKKQK